MKWAIFYDDGDILTHKAIRIRKQGVVCILQEYEGKRNIQNRTDYYVLTDVWLNCDTYGVLDHVINKLEDVKMVIAGRMISNERYRQVFNGARDYVFED